MTPFFLALSLFASSPPYDLLTVARPPEVAKAQAGEADSAIDALAKAREALLALDASYAAQIAALQAERAKIAKALGGSTPKPPDPIDPPGPVLSDTAAKVRALVVAKVSAAKRSRGEVLASVYRTRAANIQETDTPAAIIKATGEMVVANLGADLEAWRPFFNALRDLLNAQAAAGALLTPADHRRVWNEVADGLEAGAGVTAQR